jgi:hypothetical protein
MKEGTRLRRALAGRRRRTAELDRTLHVAQVKLEQLRRAARQARTAYGRESTHLRRCAWQRAFEAERGQADVIRELRRRRAASARKGARWERELANYRTRLRTAASDRMYGGTRAVTNEVIRIVDGRAPVTSRKRAAWDPLSRANPSSDHNAANLDADAVDFGIANAYSLAYEIAAELGAPGQWSGDYDEFTVRHNGQTYRVQMIAGTHGTGPHLHVGVRRA